MTIQRGKSVSNYTPHPGSLWIEANWAVLELSYNNEWIAADAGGVVAHDASIDEVIRTIQSRGLKTEDVCFSYVSTDDSP